MSEQEKVIKDKIIHAVDLFMANNLEFAEDLAEKIYEELKPFLKEEL